MRALRCAFTTRPIPGMTNLPAPPLASLTASLWSSSKKRAACFFGVLSFSAMCATIFVLLSGLAAIYFAYPPEFSFHPGAAGTSRRILPTTHFVSEKIRAEGDYSQLRLITQAKTGEKSGKNEDFLV